jgi:hypothetical protein
MPEEKVSLSQPLPVPQDFTIPTDVVPLPSEGKVYPAGHPLSGAKGVEIRSMTAREEDILTSRALLKNNKVISMLLKACMVDKTVDTDKLLIGDRNAILIGIRITGYGPEYETAITCPECRETVKRSVDLRELPIKQFPKDMGPVKPGVNEFDFILPRLGKKVVFKLMDGADEKELMSYAENSKKQGIIEELVTTRHLIMIQSIGGETDKGKLAQIIRNMPASDSRAFRKHVDKITPGVELTMPFVCGACGTETKEVEVPLGTEFFWPRT